MVATLHEVPTWASAPPIRARATRFDLSDTPAHWVVGDPQTTHTMNVLHLFLPPGERWFCDVYRDALPLITDPQLRDEARGFLAQEATHAKAHDFGMEHLAAHGIDLRPQVAHVDRNRVRLRRFVHKLPPSLRRRVLTAELAAIAAIEHFTAVLGIWVINSPALDDVPTDPAMLDMLRWHGAEEVEHRSVAFDLFEHLSGSYPGRVVSMALTAVLLPAAWLIATSVLLLMDPTIKAHFSGKELRRAIRQGRLPDLRDLGRAIPDYMQRDFHPSREGSTEQALAYLASSPGVVRRRAKPAAG